jgi:putative redox protein
MIANAKWNGRMSFTGVANSGFPVDMDTDVTFGGENSAIRPIELLALGLAGCTGMDVMSILQKKRQEVSSFEVKVDAARAKEHPKVFTGAVIRYVVSGKDIDASAVVRAIELSATKYCPAQIMFEKVFPIELRYEIHDDGDADLIQEGMVDLLNVE